MRLTLRTLLAYLDDVLDPVDKEELSQKIESSEFAEELVHRTRDTVRRLRLSAPQVIGTGMGLDPNTVAEYLDNVMPADQVGDFERICLESDVHLAEATACHHVLTMVLGAPADVDPIARQRMYTIDSEANDRQRMRVESAHTAAAASALVPVQPIATPAIHAPQSHSVEIPEYLRGLLVAIHQCRNRIGGRCTNRHCHRIRVWSARLVRRQQAARTTYNSEFAADKHRTGKRRC